MGITLSTLNPGRDVKIPVKKVAIKEEDKIVQMRGFL